jgi:hypothetical protein
MNSLRSLLLVGILVSGLFLNLSGQHHHVAMDVVFYNVENLFDTLDHPEKIDEEFLPGTDKDWNTERYEKKLKDLSKVIRTSAGGEAPEILGLCEIENHGVLEDLGKTLRPAHPYNIVHFESPDARGIDVALMFQNGINVTEKSSEFIRLDFPDEEEPYTSRDILYVVLDLQSSNFDLHLFVNHWPSRRGGLDASEPRRVVAATALKNKIDEIQKADPTAMILCMGDFNDEPDNNSLRKTLGASLFTPQVIVPRNLYNLCGMDDAQGKGTYNYRGNWNMLDQFVATGSFIRKMHPTPVRILQEKWMMYQSEKYGATPNRTYGGPNYYGGFSDHLPIALEVYWH